MLTYKYRLFLGAAGLVVGFPLDTVKVRIQTQDPTKGKLKYTSTFQCLRSIIKEEGVRTFSIYFVRSFSICSSFLKYERFCEAFFHLSEKHNCKQSL